MTEHDTRHTGETARRAPRDVASATTDYVREGVDRASDYAHELTERASERVADFTERAGDRVAQITGRPPDAWFRDLRQFVEHSPVKALIIAIGLGYVFGRVARRD